MEVTKIKQYIERDSKANAVQVVGQFLETANRLKTFPLSGRMVPEWKRPAVRELIVGSYRLMYSIKEADIIIFSVRHSRRRLPRRFRSEWLR